MTREQYLALVRLLDLPVGACPNVRLLRELFPGTPVETFISIYSQESQYRVIKTNHHHKARVDEYLARYTAGEDILLLSASVNFPASLLLRRMLESLLRVHKQCIGDVLKCPSLLPGLLPLEALPQASTSSARHAQPPGSSSSHQDNGARAAGGASGSGAQAAGGGSSSGSAASGSAGGSGGVAAGTELVARLQRDVGRCTLADCSYSPYADVAKQATGLEFEQLLADKLRAAGVGFFWTEAELRAQGYHKTPDVRLQVPIAVRDTRARAQPGGRAWRVVSWIDSKATFGDDRTHAKQLEEQYSTYVNRYGPGLIIYWFGFINDLDTDPEVAIMDRFPDADEITVLPVLAAPGDSGDTLQAQ